MGAREAEKGRATGGRIEIGIALIAGQGTGISAPGEGGGVGKYCRTTYIMSNYEASKARADPLLCP